MFSIRNSRRDTHPYRSASQGPFRLRLGLITRGTYQRR